MISSTGSVWCIAKELLGWVTEIYIMCTLRIIVSKSRTPNYKDETLFRLKLNQRLF